MTIWIICLLYYFIQLISPPGSDNLRSGLKFYLWSFISQPKNDSFRKDLCFSPDFFFLLREISKIRGPTGMKFCTMVSTRPYFIMPVQNFGGYSKSVSYSFDIDSSRVRRNKSGEVWSSNLGDLDVESYPPKVHFSEDHISAPRGCCTPKFLHALENDQVLLAHPPPGTAAPLTTKGGQKLA